MGPSKTKSFFLLTLILPFSYCYVDSVTLTLIQRMAALETRDKEKTIVFERLTKQLGYQEENMKVMKLTIENLTKDVAKLSSTWQENDERFPKLHHNLSKLSEESNRLQVPNNHPEKMLLQADTGISETIFNQANDLHFYLNKTQPKNKTMEAKKSKYSKQVVKGVSIPIKDKKHLKSSKERLVANIEGPVAFHAVSDRGEINHLGTDENIKFETILLNAGGGYHTQHGLFIAPKAGIYLFFTSVLSAGSMIYAEIAKNGASLAKAYGRGQSKTIDTQGSVSVATQMDVGDEVWVKHTFPADGNLWGERFTSFTGVLISS
ncbi:uncharacterized protein LOC132737659 [Ruditapes philippinarum]|uniref:uncharacterized protein LOC132737659 n=1 Tax=Ruditapes philippinarum TaxID=129788 RepID=UPI00295ACC7A|nr:uncharacterized protein LOC132737659 [Ruditapes philippinarum]